jgi:hypothetical protein
MQRAIPRNCIWLDLSKVQYEKAQRNTRIETTLQSSTDISIAQNDLYTGGGSLDPWSRFSVNEANKAEEM